VAAAVPPQFIGGRPLALGDPSHGREPRAAALATERPPPRCAASTPPEPGPQPPGRRTWAFAARRPRPPSAHAAVSTPGPGGRGRLGRPPSLGAQVTRPSTLGAAAVPAPTQRLSLGGRPLSRRRPPRTRGPCDPAVALGHLQHGGRGRPNPNPWRPPSHLHEAPPPISRGSPLATWRPTTRMESWRPRPAPPEYGGRGLPSVLLGGRGRAKKKKSGLRPAAPPEAGGERVRGQPARSAGSPPRHKGPTGRGYPALVTWRKR